MATTTPLQDLPVPEITDDPDVVGDINALANAIEKKLAGVYNSVADRDARITAPVEGQVAILRDLDKGYIYLAGGWKQFYPASGPSITSGTTAPSNATGANGDLYLRY